MSRYCFVALLIQTLVVFALATAADAAEPAELEFVESGGTFAEKNLAAAAAGATPFASGDYGSHHTIDKLNDGQYGNTDSWIGQSDRSFAGIRFRQRAEIVAVAFGRDNTGKFTDRSIGTYHVQYTNVEKPDEHTPDERWTTIAVIDYGVSPPPKPAQRHLFRFAKITATGLRVITDRNERKATHLLAIDELEVYGSDAGLPTGEKGDWKPVLIDPDDLPPPWKSPLVKKGKLNSPLVEVTPFVFGGRYYMLENWRHAWDVPESPCSDRDVEQLWIRDVETGKCISRALAGHSLGIAFVWDERVYVFAANGDKQRKEISMTHSEDLKSWSEPVVVLRADPNETFFNVSVCRTADRFVLLVETNDPKWPAFTFKYFTSDDLRSWTQVPDAFYGTNKYVGGPALYYEGGTYYTLYLQSLGGGRYETRITRSEDLIHWEDAPEDRPFVTFDPKNLVHPIRSKTIHECNASDAEVVYWEGKTLVYFTGGDQHAAGDLQWAEFDGTPGELFELFFKPAALADSRTRASHDADRSARPAPPQGAVDCVPSSQQLVYQNNQLGAFVHFGPATYVGGDMHRTPDPKVFNPVNLDAEQWVRTAKSFGTRHVVLTAKHHNGYCLWPTETTDYCVRSSPWKNGKGDVVRELADACKKHGMPLGLYVSGADKHYGCYSVGTLNNSGKPVNREIAGDRNAYFRFFMRQLEELLAGYGEIRVVWFDGYLDPFGPDVLNPETGQPFGSAHGDAIAALVREVQPRAVIFGGTKPDVRWSGSEQGWAPYPLWNVVRHGEGLKNWLPGDAQGWFIPEANIHTRSTWFWTPDSDPTLRSTSYLMQAYHNSIGRGANLLVNLTPDTSGLIPQAEVTRLAEFGSALRRQFPQPVAQTDSSKGWTSAGVLELKFPKTTTVDHVVIEEDIAGGQHILSYVIDALIDDRWREVAKGQSIGRKRIERIKPMATSMIRLRVIKANAKPGVRSLAAYRSLP